MTLPDDSWNGDRQAGGPANAHPYVPSTAERPLRGRRWGRRLWCPSSASWLLGELGSARRAAQPMPATARYDRPGVDLRGAQRQRARRGRVHRVQFENAPAAYATFRDKKDVREVVIKPYEHTAAVTGRVAFPCANLVKAPATSSRPAVHPPSGPDA